MAGSGVKPLLNVVAMGDGNIPVCLLHGFGSACRYWRLVQAPLATERLVLAYDLPGHGGSGAVDWGNGAGEAAEIIAGDLAERGVGRLHLCGHSLGGAVASVFALKFPEKAASLTLLAPGGFGPEINARLIRRYAKAGNVAELEPLLEQQYGAATPLPKGLAEQTMADRMVAGGNTQLPKIAESFLVGEEQGQLPIDKIAGLGMPIRVVWGTQDRITPTRQAHNLPGTMAVHIFDGVGHSIADEIPDAVLRVIAENIS
jgi:pimeloyl-ACP methyl ester carboxylesterase